MWDVTGLDDTPLSSQELFKMVVPHECLGSVWSQRTKPGNEHLAPTVRATITQFNSVANCVITTCLGNPSMVAQDRATVVEYWITVAMVCYGRPSGGRIQSLERRLSSFISSQDSSLRSTALHSV